MSTSPSCSAGLSRPRSRLPSASSINGRISLLADLALQDDARAQPCTSHQSTAPSDIVGDMRTVMPPSPPGRHKKRRISRREPKVLSAPPPHLPPTYHPYDDHLGTASKFHYPYHINPPSLPTYPPTPMWHSSSAGFVLPTWACSGSGSACHHWPTLDMDEKIISHHRLSKASPPFPPHRPDYHFPSQPCHYIADSPSPRKSKVHPPPSHTAPPTPTAYLPPRLRPDQPTALSSAPVPASGPEWDSASQELVLVPTKRDQPKRRDIGRRRQQNADAQKRFRSKKKRFEEQNNKELEEAKNKIRARDEIISQLRQENAELCKINDLFSSPWSSVSPSSS